MQSDTVVGIIGAVVLVSVMVGVFAYEYNNAPAEVAEEPTETERMASFNETFPALSAMGDMDGDGIMNYNDTDLDNDGIDNGNDTELKIEHAVSGNIGVGVNGPAGPAPAGYRSPAFAAEAGLMHVMIEISQPALANGQTLGALEVRVEFPDGTGRAVPATAAGADIVYSMTWDAELSAGDYFVTVQIPENSASRSVGFAGSLSFHYIGA